jgi:N-acyl-D-aspartate/D-glutamate deacylase
VADAKFIRGVAMIALAVTAATALVAVAPQEPAADIIIRGGTVYPGNVAPFLGDIAIRADRIIYVGPKAPGGAKKIIDATGLVVAPGFIDPHTHADEALASNDPAARLVLPFLMQGVTTAFIGVDGHGDPNVARTLGHMVAKETIAGRTSAHSDRDFGINFASYVGLGDVRKQVIGEDNRMPTARELTQMADLVSDAMCQGALGLSTGLFYAPQSFAKSDEVIALARAAAAKGGIYDSHLRDESSYTIGLHDAIEDALTIGREARIPVHIAHIKALGVDVHGHAPSIIAMIESAQRAGQVVHADQYAWSASHTGLSAAVIPRSAQDGGRAAMLKRFDDAPTMEKMRPEIAENLRRRGGAASLLITSGSADAQGKTLEAIATEQGVDPVAAAIAILKQSEARVASFNQSENDIAAFMMRPWVVTSSDATLGHPRYYGSFARKYATYVKDKKVMSLQAFIDQSTSTTAAMFALKGRGQLKVGAFADVIAFDPKSFAPRADYANPFLLATGMQMVLVNGQLAIENGAPTGIAAGRPLPRQPIAGACR